MSRRINTTVIGWIPVRLPAELIELVDERARAETRSRAGQVAHLVRRALEAERSEERA